LQKMGLDCSFQSNISVSDLASQRHVFFDTRAIDGAGPFPDRLLHAIEACKVFVCLLADTTLASEWVGIEIAHANSLGKPMIPLFQESYVPPQGPLTPSLAALLQNEGVHILDVKNIYIEQSMDELAAMIKATHTKSRRLRAFPPALVGAVCTLLLLIVIAVVVGKIRGNALERSGTTPTPVLSNTPENSATVARVPMVKTNSQWVPRIRDFLGVEMALVPPGCFRMGSSDADIAALNQQYNTSEFSDEAPQTPVCFDTAFWIDKTDVTQAQFKQFSGQAVLSPAFVGGNRPVENVTWFEARDFCARRAARLPTEAEWEYAARGPSGPVYPWGNTFDSSRAIYNRDPSQGTADVGTLINGASWVGALDMSGNVWQWVGTIYKSYPYDASDGREDATDSNSQRVLRGGSWDLSEQYLWTAYRYKFDPAHQDNHLGFRCARAFDS